MYSLLSPNHKKRAVQYFYIRFAVFGAWLLFLLGVFLVMVLAPSYMHVLQQRTELAQCVTSAENAKRVAEEKKVSEKGIVQESEYVRMVFETYNAKPDAVEILDAVTLILQPHAELHSITYIDEGSAIVISGSARVREDLVAIAEAFDTDDRFLDVPRITQVLRQDPATFQLHMKYNDESL